MGRSCHYVTTGGSRAQSHKQEQWPAQILSDSWRPDDHLLVHRVLADVVERQPAPDNGHHVV